MRNLPAVLFFLLVVIAGAKNRFAGDGSSLESLRISNQIDGWHEVKNGFIPFDHDKLFELINGGAPEYIDEGLIRGFLQRLEGPDSATVELYAEDFGAPEKAINMFRIKRENHGSLLRLTGFDTGVAGVFSAIGARVAYGAIGRFFFEITVSGSAGVENADTVLRNLFHFYTNSITSASSDR